ncbi:hypothetical protein BDV23DRAFT_157586 [Aspergillus alliaceus]|uniref:Uncharacterized protein n=1 Tax=Petromyces alliaceus TaxID=209559 RepID=A0A5N7C585_PETAA|nr:hypothetical protein BDV23DRAFT_157586 [Aspergillus alliaceus]
MPIHCRSMPSACNGLSSTAFYHHIRITSLECFLRLATTSLPNSGDTRCPQHSFFGMIVISRCFMNACTLMSWRNHLFCLKLNIRKSLITNRCFAVLAWLGLPLLPWVLNQSSPLHLSVHVSYEAIVREPHAFILVELKLLQVQSPFCQLSCRLTLEHFFLHSGAT